MQHRVCFDATDINRIVFTVPQAEILKEIRLAAMILSKELSETSRFYWQDKSDAYKLALYVSEWAGKNIIVPILAISAENEALRDKLYSRITSRTPVRGGIASG